MESNVKSAFKVATVTDELQYLMDFNVSISQAMAKTIEHLTDFVFVSMTTRLTRKDAYLSHLKSLIKPDILATLRTAPLQLTTLLPYNVIKQAEEDVSSYESKGLQCFRLCTNVCKFTPKSSDLRTYYLPGGQTDAEVFVKRNINILSIYEAVLYLFQFQNKMADFLLFTCNCAFVG